MVTLPPSTPSPQGLTFDREQQAYREVGHTQVSRSRAWILTLILLATIVAVPVVDLGTRQRVRTAFAELIDRATEALSGLMAHPVRANRALLAGMVDFEDDLEEGSFLRDVVLPPVQLFTARWLGLGNEQAYLGRSGWLFYRSDVDHAVGPGFLSERALEVSRLADQKQASLRVKDPRPALARFAQDLAARGIRLLVMPTPVKPQVEPEHFSTRYGAEPGVVSDPSYDEFLAWLERQGIPVLEVGPLLASAQRSEGTPLYLATDTHWTPAAMDRVAQALADRVAQLAGWSVPGLAGYEQREVIVEGIGDIALMLNLPPEQRLYPPETVRVRRVLTWRGEGWHPNPQAEVLLLGDSFTNIYSEPTLNFGSGAGLAPRLAFHLQRPVDVIARNAGGSYASREALLAALKRDPERLAGTRVVIYQFATRELSQGDWKVLPLPAAE